jgi:hypothetical protein
MQMSREQRDETIENVAALDDPLDVSRMTRE